MKNNSYLNRIIDVARSNKVKMLGCSESEIMEVSGLNPNYSLPEVYLFFLEKMGKGIGTFLNSSFMFYPDILKLKINSNLLLTSNGLEPFSPEYFIFFNHQGYQVAAFKMSSESNPKVSYFSEGAGEARIIETKDNFETFLEKQLQLEGFADFGYG